MPIRKKKSTPKKRSTLLRRTKLTDKEYKHLTGKAAIKFRERSLHLRDKNFVVELYRKVRVKKRGKIRSRWVRISADEFIPRKEYQVYIKHKPTKQRRLLAIGVLRDIPIRSKQVDRFAYQLGGRTFDPSLPYPKKAKGRWVPVNKIIGTIQSELRSVGKELRSEVRAAIIPLKRYYNTNWLIYSDKILPGKTLVRKVFVNCAVQFIYPNQDWIGKQSVFLEFRRGIRLEKLHTLTERLEERINNDLEFLHPQAENVSLININGFIPIGV